MMKYLKYLLLCAGLLAVLTGCGKQTDAPDAPDIMSDASSTAESETDADSNPEQETESESESELIEASEQETEQETEKNSDNSEITETAPPEQTASSATEASNSTNSNTITTTEAEHLVAETLNQNQNQNQNPEQDQNPGSQDTPDIPDTPEIPDAPPEVTQASAPDVTEPEITEPIAEDPDALNITYQGQVITIGGDVKKFTESVKPNFEQSAPSCMGDGEDIVYYYDDDLTIYVWSNAGSMLVTGVDVTSPGIAPVQGYDIGETADFTNEKVIDCGNDCMIILAEVGGQIISISYNKDF